jgi:CHAT domain-containing protein/tetratricopeptide (TPR) repeat protein
MREMFMIRGRYDSALYYADEAAAIMRGTIGEKNLQYCFMLRKLAYAHFYLGNYKKAKYFIIREAALWEALKKTSDREYIFCLEAASVICRRAGEYEEALAQIRKADKKAADLYKEDSPEYAEILYNYAGVYHDMGCASNDMIYLNQEEKYLKRAESIYRSTGEKGQDKFYINLSDQASWNNNIGNTPLAEKMLLQVAEFCKKEYGPQNPGYASALNNVAVLYYNSGNYKLAENNFNEALAIYKSGIGARKSETGICLNNLGALYYKIGNFEFASALINESRAIFEECRQTESPLYSVILNNLASVILCEEYYSSPEDKNGARLTTSWDLIQKADSVFRLNCQAPHPYYLPVTCNLGIWYNIKGDKVKSFQTLVKMSEDANMSLRVVAMMNKLSMSDKLPVMPGYNPAPDPAIIPISNTLYNEVSASNSKGSASDDMKGITTALIRMVAGKADNIKKAVGPYHPAYGEMLKSLIIVYASIDDFKREEELTLEYLNVINHKMLQDFSYLSESEKEMYYQTRLPDQHSFASYSLMRKRTNPMITRQTYDNVLLNKGLMLKSSTAMRLAILSSNDPVLLKEYDEWIALQKEISALYSTPVDLRVKNLSEIENQANVLERSLVSRSQDFSDYRKGLQITWDDVRKNLKSDEAAIEFTDFKRREKDGGYLSTYCALVLRPDSEYPEMVKLFTEDQLEAVLDRSGMNNLTGINDIYGTLSSQDARLYNLIWKPIEEYLEGVKIVYVSPSGMLNKISFSAISNGKGVYLCDRFQVQIKGSTGTVTTQNLFSAGSRSAALILGGIQYSNAGSDSDVWSYLKGTKDEGDAVTGILEKGGVSVQYLSGNKATETYLKENAGTYNILHLATHGFFFDDPNKKRIEENSNKIEFGQITFRGASSSAYGVSSFVNSENPLMRSGLVLAGANDVWLKPEKGGSEDGVLTAQEVTQIDLRKNDLVVLSACETGLGDIKGNEGVYGMQRSLKMAGVKYIIESLWEIPDNETVEFMSKFYSNLIKDKDIKQAFYGAQKSMRTKYDPYFWGAFVLLE